MCHFCSEQGGAETHSCGSIALSLKCFRMQHEKINWCSVSKNNNRGYFTTPCMTQDTAHWIVLSLVISDRVAESKKKWKNEKVKLRWSLMGIKSLSCRWRSNEEQVNQVTYLFSGNCSFFCLSTWLSLFFSSETSSYILTRQNITFHVHQCLTN